GMPSNPSPGVATAPASQPAASTNPSSPANPTANPSPKANPARPTLPTGPILNSGGFHLITVGDSLRVTFADVTAPLQPVEQTVKEDGTITLIHNQTFVAAGKRRGVLEKEIHDRYVPDYYKYLTANVFILGRFYYVNGEVKSPNRYV